MKQRRIKDILSDIDGTILSEKDTFNPRLPSVIAKTIENNVSIGFATNRSIKFCMNVYRNLGAKRPYNP